MTWEQTLVVALVPVLVTAVSLITQQVLTNRREESRLTHESAEREKERTHAASMAGEARDHEVINADLRRSNENQARLRALHVEMLTALDEIYHKLRAHQRLAERAGPQDHVFLPDKPDLTRLIAAHSAVRIEASQGGSVNAIDAPVELLAELHSDAAAVDDRPPDLSRLDGYEGLRRNYVGMAVIDLADQ